MERMDELRRPEERTRLMYRIVCWVSGLVILTTVLYAFAASAFYTTGSLSEVGNSLVDVNFPLPYFAQPATYLSVASVTFFYTGIRLWQNKVAQWSHLVLASLQLLAIVVAFASAYEVLYGFMLWGSYSSAQIIYGSLQAGANFLSNPGPSPWGLVLSTKVYAALFAISGYSVYFLRKVHSVRGLSENI